MVGTPGTFQAQFPSASGLLDSVAIAADGCATMKPVSSESATASRSEILAWKKPFESEPCRSRTRGRGVSGSDASGTCTRTG